MCSGSIETRELYRCRAHVTFRKDVVVPAKDGGLLLNMVWKDKTKGKLRVYGDRLEFKNFFCRPFVIPYDSIQHACLFTTKLMGFQCRVLWIIYSKNAIGIAVGNNNFWGEPLPFRVIRETAGCSKADMFKGIAAHIATTCLSGAVGATFNDPDLGEIVGDIVSEVTEDSLDEVVPPTATSDVAKPRLPEMATHSKTMASPKRKRVPVQWFYRKNTQQFGPFKASQLKRLAEQSIISRGTAVRRSIDTTWIRAGKVIGLFADAPVAASPTINEVQVESRPPIRSMARKSVPNRKARPATAHPPPITHRPRNQRARHLNGGSPASLSFLRFSALSLPWFSWGQLWMSCLKMGETWKTCWNQSTAA